MKCLEKAPADRPQTAVELVDALRDCGVGEWTDLDAKRWWDKNGGVLQERHMTRTDVATGHTMDIDLARRAGIAID